MKRIVGILTATLLIGALAAPASAAASNSYCQGYFMSEATLELPAGYWTVGDHSLAIHFIDVGFDYDDVWGPFPFSVSETAPLYRGQVMIAAGVFSAGWTEVPGQMINPAQDTFVWAGWAFGPGAYGPGPSPNIRAAYADLADASIAFSIDGGPEILARQGPWVNYCASSGMGRFTRTFGPRITP